MYLVCVWWDLFLLFMYVFCLVKIVYLFVFVVFCDSSVLCCVSCTSYVVCYVSVMLHCVTYVCCVSLCDVCVLGFYCSCHYGDTNSACTGRYKKIVLGSFLNRKLLRFRMQEF